MRRTYARKLGLLATAKAIAVILAVGMLAVVAGKAGYTSETAIAAPPAHVLAAGAAGIAAPDPQFPMPPRTMAAPAPDEAPIPSF